VIQTQEEKDKYLKLVQELSPNSHIVKDCIKAFFVGGLICAFGQLIFNILIYYKFSDDNSGMYTSVILIFLGVALTGLGLYSKVGKFSGAGSTVPITGFANSVAAPAIEFKKEGFIFGVGSKMFIVAGAVIVYGISSSMIYGVIYYILSKLS
jgi:stage V sporulation protein AC